MPAPTFADLWSPSTSPTAPAPLFCPRCGVTGVPDISPGVGPHYARADCAACGRSLRWLPKPLAPDVADELYEERAAIMEYDGGLPRAEAERLARECVWRQQEVIDIFGATPVEKAASVPQVATTPQSGVQLREYQQKAVDALLAALSAGEHPVCAMATGGGKSLVIAELCRRLSGRILVATHRKELLAQNNGQLTRLLGEAADAGLYSAGLRQRDTAQRVIFGGVQSIYRRMAALQAAGMFKYVIVDECHLVPDRSIESMYRTVFEACPEAQRIGLSATPYRLEGGAIASRDETWFTSVAVDVGIRLLTDLGHLAPLVGIRAAADIDLSQVRTRQGDYVQSDLSQVMSEERRVREAVAEMIQLAAARKSWLAFCVDVTHTELVTEALRDAGIDARMVVGTTPQDERDALLRDFRAQEFRCLVNCQVATTGFDIPQIDCVILLRPTQSKGLLVQMLGRGTRLADGKVDCVILDYADTIKPHLPLDEVPTLSNSPAVEQAERDKAEAEARAAQERKPKHSSSALEQADSQRRHTVARMAYEVTPSRKQPGKSLLRVSYLCPERPKPWLSQWLCIEYTGWSRLVAQAWFQRRDARCPLAAAEALRVAQRTLKPRAILVDESEKFPRVLVEYF